LIHINDRSCGSRADHRCATDCSATTSGPAAMAETTRLSVEKALQKLRDTDAPKSRKKQLDDKIEVLDEEIQRMRAQRLRLERHQRNKRD
jgi:TolA-binding protein